MYDKQYFVYILTNKNNTVLYIGITSNLLGRIFQHKEQAITGFTSRYNVDKLVYYEVYEDAYEAISREKQLKNLVRRKKDILINEFNPKWLDLSDKLWFTPSSWSEAIGSHWDSIGLRPPEWRRNLSKDI